MYAKTGLSFIAAAGVAFGVVGMTMGGASSAPSPYCAPASPGATPASGLRSDGANASGASVASAGALGPVGPAGPTDPNGSDPTGPIGPAGMDTDGPGSSLISVDVDAETGSGPGSVPGAPTQPPSSSSHGSDHFLDVRGTTDHVHVADTVTAPPSDTHVVGRSQPIGELLHVDGVVDLGR